MKFYGREKQRKDLHRLFLYEGMQLGLIYGRRRVGKSELIKQSLRETDVTSIYFECKQTTEQNNTESLSVLLADTFHFPKPSFDSMEALLTYLFEAAKEKPMILVLDEYPYLREVVRGMDSVLQALVDRYRDRHRINSIYIYDKQIISLLTEECNVHSLFDSISRMFSARRHRRAGHSSVGSGGWAQRKAWYRE